MASRIAHDCIVECSRRTEGNRRRLVRVSHDALRGMHVKSDSDSAYCSDDPVRSDRCELVSEVRDVYAQQSVVLPWDTVFENACRPDVLNELLVAENAPLVLREKRDELVLLVGEGNSVVMPPHFVCSDVNFKRINSYGFLVVEVQVLLDAREELARIEGFGEVIVRAVLEEFHLGFDGIPSGQDDDGEGPMGASQSRGDFRAVEVGQSEVEHDQVGMLSAGGHQPSRSSHGSEGVKAGGREGLSEQCLEIGVVVDDEDAVWHVEASFMSRGRGNEWGT